VRCGQNLIILSFGWFCLAQNVEEQLCAVRDAQLFEDAEKIILYRVLTEPEFFGHFTIRQASSDQARDLFFPLRQTRGLAELARRDMHHCSDHVLQLAVVCPDLTIMHCLYTLAQIGGYPRTAENTPGPMAKCFNNQFSFIFVEQHHHTTLGLQRTHRDTLWAMNSLAVTLREEGHFVEAEKLQRQTFEIERRVLGPEAPNTLSDTISLATTVRVEGRYSEAEKLEQPTVAAMRRVLGPEHPYTLTATDELAQTLGKEGRYEEAEKLARETLEIQRRVLGPDHPDAAGTAYDLACVLAQTGRSSEAISILHEAIDHGLDPVTSRAMATDPELKSLHKDPRFEALVSYARQRAAAPNPN